MTEHTHDHDHDHSDDEGDADFQVHTHEALYRAMSLIGALMCLRCGAFVSGLDADLRNHNKLHDDLEAVLASNGETSATLAQAELKSPKKPKKQVKK